MKEIVLELKDYGRWLDKKLLAGVSLFTAAGIWFNYGYGLNETITGFSFWGQFGSWWTVFFLAFGATHFATCAMQKASGLEPLFMLHLLLAPAIFAWKMSAEISLITRDDVAADYWNTVLYWPAKLLVIFVILAVAWKAWNRDASFFGLDKAPGSWRPYLIMLAIMIPLIAAASTQADFLSVYPKLKHVDVVPEEKYRWFYLWLYEACYGLDFVGIELFFRGFLVIGFIRWAGKGAILPMAVFYCTIHFGKPIGECISSFFGGIILGVVTYHSRTIWGGLVVHLGIAWLMELGGYLGNRFW